MPIYHPLESLVSQLTAQYKDDPTTVEMSLCLKSSWSNPPTQAEVLASIIADGNGYEGQDVTPTANAVVASGNAEITFDSASFSLSSSTLDYDAYCIVIDGTDVVYAESFNDTKTIDSAGSAHTFSGIKKQLVPITG